MVVFRFFPPAAHAPDHGKLSLATSDAGLFGRCAIHAPTQKMPCFGILIFD